MKVKDIFDNLDNCKTYIGKIDKREFIIIHPGLEYGFIELSKEFVENLKHEIKNKIMLNNADLQDIDNTTKFTLMILENCY